METNYFLKDTLDMKRKCMGHGENINIEVPLKKIYQEVK